MECEQKSTIQNVLMSPKLSENVLKLQMAQISHV